MMATDPFDPSIARLAERVADGHREARVSPPARMAPAALILPTFFGPMVLGEGADNGPRDGER